MRFSGTLPFPGFLDLAPSVPGTGREASLGTEFKDGLYYAKGVLTA